MDVMSAVLNGMRDLFDGPQQEAKVTALYQRLRRVTEGKDLEVSAANAAGGDAVAITATRRRTRSAAKSIDLTVSPAVFERDVLAFDVSGLLEALMKSAQIIREGLKRCRVQKSNHRHRRLLRDRLHRPRRRAAEQRDELAAFQLIESHSIPSSLDCRISNWQRSVSGYQGPHTCAQGPEMRKQHDLYVVADLSEVVA